MTKEEHYKKFLANYPRWSGATVCPVTADVLWNNIQGHHQRIFFDFVSGKHHRFSGLVSATHHQAIQSGEGWIADPFSWKVVETVLGLPHRHLWDACAAPGSKSILVRKHSLDVARFRATEVDGARFRRLQENLALFLKPSETVESLPGSLESRFSESEIGYWDLILCDVPCSGQTLANAPPRVFLPKTELAYAKLSRAILHSALRLRPKNLIFSTCTLGTIENEKLIQSLLPEFPSAKVQHFDRTWPSEESRGGTLWVISL